MLGEQRQLEKILREIAEEEHFLFTSLSDGWILIIENGIQKAYVYGYKFPNNNAATEHICDDKAGLSQILIKQGISAVPHEFFESPDRFSYIDPESQKREILKLLERWKEVVVKPNQGSGGHKVYKASNIEDVDGFTKEIYAVSRSCAISPYREVKHEYRIIVLNGRAKLIYEKIRPVVVGDGRSTVHELIEKQYPLQKIDSGELDIVLSDGEKKIIQWKHNLGQGSAAVNVTDTAILAKLEQIGVETARVLDARFVSVDIIKSNIGYEVLEVNSGVMMEHFAKSSDKNYKIAKEIYREAIRSCFDDKVSEKDHYTRKRFVLPTLEKIADQQGVEVIQDQERGSFDIFHFKNGKYFVAKDYPFNTNYSGSAKLCKSKGACSYFLRKMGFCVPQERSFIKSLCLEETLRRVKSYLESPNEMLGFDYPLIIKPNSLTQGIGVFKVNNVEEGIEAVKEIQKIQDNCFIIQEYIPGHDCRIVVLKGEIIQAYERIPFSIEGDGISSIRELLFMQQESFKQMKRDKYVDIEDNRIWKKIKQNGYEEESVLKNGERIVIQDICNLSLGGSAKDIESIVSERIKKIAISVAEKLNLHLCGIDFMLEDLSGENYSIIEVNSAPGFDNYLYEGQERESYLESLYSKVLQAITNDRS